MNHPTTQDRHQTQGPRLLGDILAEIIERCLALSAVGGDFAPMVESTQHREATPADQDQAGSPER